MFWAFLLVGRVELRTSFQFRREIGLDQLFGSPSLGFMPGGRFDSMTVDFGVDDRKITTGNRGQRVADAMCLRGAGVWQMIVLQVAASEDGPWSILVTHSKHKKEKGNTVSRYPRHVLDYNGISTPASAVAAQLSTSGTRG